MIKWERDVPGRYVAETTEYTYLASKRGDRWLLSCRSLVTGLEAGDAWLDTLNACKNLAEEHARTGGALVNYLDTGKFNGLSLGAPVRVRWEIDNRTRRWFVRETGDGFSETTAGHGRESLDSYLESLRLENPR